MMVQIAFHALAAQELSEIYTWYAERDSEVALRLSDAIDDGLQRIHDNPQSHPIECKHYRWVRVRRFPYRLVFEELDQDRVLIVAVAHTSRKPVYWEDRT